mmetsp:Transcript_865/g.1153  ORF Transcript_865/g.1153 Transcript_865/m.1153 type:complete len:284 (-) Transcript_865:246-1097(-)
MELKSKIPTDYDEDYFRKPFSDLELKFGDAYFTSNDFLEKEVQKFLNLSHFADISCVESRDGLQYSTAYRRDTELQFHADFAIGTKENFLEFADYFASSYTPSPPSTENFNFLVVTKTNLNLLKEWIKEGNNSFFSTVEVFGYKKVDTKALVLHGVDEDLEAIMHFLKTDTSSCEYQDILDTIQASGINVFMYRPLISNKTKKFMNRIIMSLRMIDDHQKAILGDQQEIIDNQEMIESLQENILDNQNLILENIESINEANRSISETVEEIIKKQTEFENEQL